MKLIVPGIGWLFLMLWMGLSGWNLVETPANPTAAAHPSLGSCPNLPANNIWNQWDDRRR